MKDIFRRIANRVSVVAGSAWAFSLAILIILSWLVTGPVFGFSDTWQLVINTGTTIVTFLMVFLIQSTQNRDAKAMQIKLDELIRATRARDSFIDIEDLSDDELAVLALKFQKIHKIKTPDKSEKTLFKDHDQDGGAVTDQMSNMWASIAEHILNEKKSKN
jgi:low affinity Fe/Cu permease